MIPLRMTQTCGALPSVMRAARVHGEGNTRVLRVDTVALPRVTPNTVLVRVHAASVNPVDWKLQDEGDLKPLAIPVGTLPERWWLWVPVSRAIDAVIVWRARWIRWRRAVAMPSIWWHRSMPW